MIWLSTAISILALSFTVISFWWLFAKRGELVAYEPYSFAAQVSDTISLNLRFPLVLRNTGAQPLVVQNLRLCFPDVKESILALPWKTSRSQLKPSNDDGHQFPAIFSISGRTAGQFFIEFGAPFPGFKLERQEYRVRIEVVVAHKKGWQPLVEFNLRGQNMLEDQSSYLTYSNAPHMQTAEDKAKWEARANELIRVMSKTIYEKLDEKPDVRNLE